MTTAEAAPSTQGQAKKNEGGDKKAQVTGGSGLDFKSMNRDKLMDAYSALVVTAKELQVEFHSVKPDVPEGDLRNACLALDARITLKKRAIEKHQAEQTRKTAKAAKAERAKARAEKATKSEAAKGGEDATEDETTMAARKTTSKSSTSKARGAVRGKTKKATGGKRSTFDAASKIQITDKTNPRREGSGKYDEYALLLKYNGKTVGAFLEAGGKAKTIASMVRRKLGKVA